MGVYVLVKINSLTGDLRVAVSGGFVNAVRQVMKRLNMKWDENQSVKDSKNGKTTQIPVNACFVVSKPYRRVIEYGTQKAIFKFSL